MPSNPRGLICAGGTGTRLRPLTKVMNKHLLPILDKPMVLFPLETLEDLGIKEICLVTGEKDLESFKKLLGDGSEFDSSITYRTQEGPNGIADALLKAEDYLKGHKTVMILGDHLYGEIKMPKKALEDDYAYVFIQKFNRGESEDGQSWGAVPEFDKSGNIIGIEEKPKNPKSDHIVTGLYIYPDDVFDHIKMQKPSKRGELEITDVNNWYISQKRLKSIKIENFILDAGTFETLFKATIYRAKELGYDVDYKPKRQ